MTLKKKSSLKKRLMRKRRKARQIAEKMLVLESSSRKTMLSGEGGSLPESQGKDVEHVVVHKFVSDLNEGQLTKKQNARNDLDGGTESEVKNGVAVVLGKTSSDCAIVGAGTVLTEGQNNAKKRKRSLYKIKLEKQKAQRELDGRKNTFCKGESRLVSKNKDEEGVEMSSNCANVDARVTSNSESHVTESQINVKSRKNRLRNRRRKMRNAQKRKEQNAEKVLEGGSVLDSEGKIEGHVEKTSPNCASVDFSGNENKTIEIKNDVSDVCMKADKVQQVPSFDSTCDEKKTIEIKNDVTDVRTNVESIPLVATVELSCDEGKTIQIRNDVSGVCIEVNTVPQVPSISLKEPQVECARKKLLVLDINGLLADIVPYVPLGYKPDTIISRKSVFKRPFCNDFLRFCLQKFNVGVWSSRTRKNVATAIDFLMKDSRHKLLFCWDQSHCTSTGFKTIENTDKPLVLKELKKLWENTDGSLPWKRGEYDESNTLLLDDSPYKALRNPAHTGIFPRPYRFNKRDSSLGPCGDLRVYLERLAEAESVQEFVAKHPFGQRAISESNASWGFYSKIINSDSSQLQSVASSSHTS